MSKSPTASSTTAEKKAEAVFCDRSGGSNRHFGSELRKCRLAVNATQAKLAKVAGISERCLRKNEHREVNPHPQTRLLLAEALARLARSQKAVASLVLLLQLAGCGGKSRLSLVLLGLTCGVAALLISVWQALEPTIDASVYGQARTSRPTPSATEDERTANARWRISEVGTFMSRMTWIGALLLRIRKRAYRIRWIGLLWHRLRCEGPVVMWQAPETGYIDEHLYRKGAIFAECQACGWPVASSAAVKQQQAQEDPRQSVEELEGLSELQEDEPPQQQDVAEHAAPFPHPGQAAAFISSLDDRKLEPVVYRFDLQGRVGHAVGCSNSNSTKGEA